METILVATWTIWYAYCNSFNKEITKKNIARIPSIANIEEIVLQKDGQLPHGVYKRMIF